VNEYAKPKSIAFTLFNQLFALNPVGSPNITPIPNPLSCASIIEEIDKNVNKIIKNNFFMTFPLVYFSDFKNTKFIFL
jgi:hypothetical protein